jgi:folate-binding protein YgfZ
MAGTHESILLFGDKTNDYIKEVFNIDTENYVNNDFEIYVEENNHSIIARNDDKFGGCIFIYDVKNSGFWKDKMLNETLKSRYKILEIDDKQFEQRRIELGIPAFGKEMTELTNPLECGIEKYISFTKGCYIGQEVIARLDTYDKINKHLVSIEAEKEFTAADTKILTDSKECGIVTSAVKNAGLGFVKTIFLDFNRIYQLKQNDIMINCKLKQIK